MFETVKHRQIIYRIEYATVDFQTNLLGDTTVGVHHVQCSASFAALCVHRTRKWVRVVYAKGLTVSTFFAHTYPAHSRPAGSHLPSFHLIDCAVHLKKIDDQLRKSATANAC